MEVEGRTTWGQSLRVTPKGNLVIIATVAGLYAYGGGPEPSKDELVALAKIVHRIVYQELHRRKRGYRRYPRSGYDNNTVIH
jgi:hypothetical protein